MKATPDLIHRVRAAFAQTPRVTEKRMFGSTGFMIGSKLAIGARADRLMCRVDPGLDLELAKRPGCRRVVMRGRTMRGYWYVDRTALSSGEVLSYWIDLV